MKKIEIPGAMVDIVRKNPTERSAVATARVILTEAVVGTILEKGVPKGDVLAHAKVAGLMAVKNTSSMLPLCHPLNVEFADVEFFEDGDSLIVQTTVKGLAKTGFEMEALTSACAAALTIYDMCKPITKEIRITDVYLKSKSGGKSGDFVHPLSGSGSVHA